MKKRSSPFKELQDASLGLAGLGMVSGVAGGIISKSPTPLPGLSQGVSTLASFAPVAGVAVGGRAVLKVLKKKKKKGGYRK